MSIIEEAAKRLSQLRQTEAEKLADIPAARKSGEPASRTTAPGRSPADLVEAAVSRAASMPPPAAPAAKPAPALPPTVSPDGAPKTASAPSDTTDIPSLEELTAQIEAIAVVDTPLQVQAPVVAAETPKEVPAASPPASNRASRSHGDNSRYVELNLAQLAAKGIVTPDAPRSQLADEFRVIKRPLLLNAQGKGAAPVVNGNLIMVTSSVPGEGKTFSAINLAMSIAMEMDNTVLLVDSDVSRPSVLNVLGLPAARGLMDVLLDDNMDLSDVMLKTNVKKFNILPVGSAAKRATELLASEAMNKLLAEMATRYSDRVIIFDSPPLLVTTEAPVLARHMGQIMMVVNSGTTGRALIKQALSTISTCPVVMMMLNKVTSPGKGGYYDYYGYGGYGAYGANVPG